MSAQERTVITVRYFAAVREALGKSTEALETTATTVGAVRRELAARGAAYVDVLAPEKTVRMALDHVMVDDDGTPIHAGAEVAFFPPVTGG